MGKCDLMAWEYIYISPSVLIAKLTSFYNELSNDFAYGND